MQGPPSAEMPDLMVVWNRSAPIAEIASPAIGTIDGIRSWGRTGDHTPNATLYGQGPAFPLATSPALVDIGPTLAAWYGVALENVSGCAIPARSTASATA